MRRIKAKKEKKTIKRKASNIPALVKNEIMTQNYLMEMKRNVTKDLDNASLLMAMAAFYFKKHRLAWDNEDACLKPSLKGLLTRTVHQFEKFSSERLKAGFIDKVKDELHKTIVEGIIGGTSQIEKKCLNANDYIIFENLILGSICVGAVKDRLKMLARHSAKTGDKLKEILKGYDRYMEFWETEIDPFNVSFK